MFAGVCLCVEVLFKLCLLIKGTVKLSWAAGGKEATELFRKQVCKAWTRRSVCAAFWNLEKKTERKKETPDRVTYMESLSVFNMHESGMKVWCSRSSHPEGASLTELEHPKHTILKLHSAVELGQVVVINSQQLKCEEIKWQEGFERDRRDDGV